jgi:hypothetical protein
MRETGAKTAAKLAKTCVEQSQKLSPGAAQKSLAQTLAGKCQPKK